MYHTTSKGPNRAEEWISTGAEANDLATDAIFLAVKCKGARGRGKKVSICSSGKIEAVMPKEELDRAKVERLGITRAIGVFSWTKEKEKCDYDHVSGGLGNGTGGMAGNESDTSNNLDGNRFDPRWRRVFLFPGSYHAFQAEIGTA